MDNANTYKPENALKRSNELIAQNQHQRALTTLHDVLIHKRGRAWFAVLEEVMMRHLKLCIELRKEKFAREGLMQYRLLCQHVNVASLDKVITSFLEQAEAKVKGAQASSEEAVKALEGRDLDEEAEASQEGLLMLAFSGGSVKDRTEREILTPWIRFLWQCYRLSLDVARQNPKFEAIFHETAKKAFAFCLRYRRRQEFRRLADTVRQYFNFQTRFKPETLSELLGNQEAFIRMVEMRFKQLSVATQLDLWNEAYKSIEDIHAVIVFFKRTPPPRLMSEYFERLSQVFWVSSHRLFHAYAVQKQYSTILNNKQSRKNATDDAIALLSSKVLLATLCVPFWDKTNMHRSKEEMFQFSQERQKHEKIIQLLGASSVPNRKNLLATMIASGILDKVYPELAKLYATVEGDVSPLNICKQVAPMADFVANNKELERYADALRRTAAVRMLEHVAQTYERISFDAVTAMCPFYTFPELELLILQVAKSEVVGGSVSIDHSNKFLSFKGREVTSDTLAGQLGVVTHRLAPLLYTCRASATRGPLHRTSARAPSDFLQKLNEQLKNEREENLRRQQVIDKRQEERELREKETEAAEKGRREEEQRKLKENEIQRMKSEQIARQQQKEEEAQRAAELEQVKLIYQTVTASVAPGKQALKKIEEMQDREKILTEAKQVLLQQKEEKERRLEKEAKRTEYFERACREEERPLLQKQWADLQAAELASKESNKQALMEEAKMKWEQALEEKRRLARMASDWDRFRNKVIQQRESQMEDDEDEEEWQEN